MSAVESEAFDLTVSLRDLYALVLEEAEQ